MQLPRRLTHVQGPVVKGWQYDDDHQPDLPGWVPAKKTPVQRPWWQLFVWRRR